MSRRIRLASLAVAGLLSACAAMPPDAPSAAGESWLELGARIYGYTEFERLSRLAAVRNEHASNPSSASAIRVALLLTGEDAPSADVESALSLLDYAERNLPEDGGADLAFIRFFRPVVQRMAVQQATLDAELSEKTALENQLEALKDLEEQLNDGD